MASFETGTIRTWKCVAGDDLVVLLFTPRWYPMECSIKPEREPRLPRQRQPREPREQLEDEVNEDEEDEGSYASSEDHESSSSSSAASDMSVHPDDLDPKALFGKLHVFYLTRWPKGCLLPVPSGSGYRSARLHALEFPFPRDFWLHGAPCKAADDGTQQRSLVIGIGVALQPL